MPIAPRLLTHPRSRLRGLGAVLLLLVLRLGAEVPPQVAEAPVAMVVSGHPEATAIGVKILRDGGHAIDAAVAVSLALGVAEPYGSGLGGKLMLIYHDASSGLTFAVDGMDAAPSSFDLAAYREAPASYIRDGWSAVAIPGALAGLELAHKRWGERPWAELVRPAADLASTGFTVLPKSRDQFAEQETKIRRDPEMTRLFLPDGDLPAIGSRLANPDLARTLTAIAQQGSDAFYRGAFAKACTAAALDAGLRLPPEDFANYAARLGEPIEANVFGTTIRGGPPPTTGLSLVLPWLKILEPWAGEGDARTDPTALDRIGRAWRLVQPRVAATIADQSDSPAAFRALLDPDFIATARTELEAPEPATTLVAAPLDPAPAFQSTTHFVIVDAAGNVVSATQSLSLHFGAGVVAPGTGVVLNNSLSNFAYRDDSSPNLGAPGKRPRSTISPAIVLKNGQPLLAIGLPGGQRIPTAMFQVLFDHLGSGRDLADAIADTRWHLLNPSGNRPPQVWQAEANWPESTIAGLSAEGWTVESSEPAGTGRYFGGFTAIEIRPDGSRRGLADIRRTNAAAGF